LIYLDNAATTQVCEAAARKAYELMTRGFGNASSTHALGRAAAKELEQARAIVAKSLNAKPGEIVFTSGGTEGDNLALKSGAALNRRWGAHIISSTVEHDAVRKTLDSLENQGFEVTRLTPEPDGSVSPERVRAALRPETILVSLMLVNNETGGVTDIAAISRILREAALRALLHCDAVQAYLKLPLDARALDVDLLTVSGHKIHAPKGVGALYVKKSLNLPPLLHGGPHEGGRRAGTEALPNIAALGVAVQEGYVNLKENTERMRGLRARAVSRLLEEIPGLTVIGGGAPHILSVSLPGYRSEVLLNYLDAKEIYVSKSSACKRGGRSHVLEALALPGAVVDGALRISFSRMSTQADIDILCDTLRGAARELVTAVR